MDAYHAPLNAYEDYIARKRMAEDPTLGDTKSLSRDDLLTGAHLWWGWDHTLLIYGLVWSLVGIPLIPFWYLYRHLRWRKLTVAEKRYVHGQMPMQMTNYAAGHPATTVTALPLRTS